MICENYNKYKYCEKYIKGKIRYIKGKKVCERCFYHIKIEDKKKRI